MTSPASRVTEDTCIRNPIGEVTTALAVASGVALLVSAVMCAVSNLGNIDFWTDESSTCMSAFGWQGTG